MPQSFVEQDDITGARDGHGSRWHAASCPRLGTMLALRRRMRLFRALLLLPMLCALGEAPAHADASATDADALFEDARRLMAEGRYVDACPLLERSEALDPGIGTEMNLAVCYDLSGKTASAWAMYQRVIEATHVAGQTAREEAARTRQQSVERRLSHVRLEIAPAARLPGLEVRRDALPVDPVTWGKAVAVDPGEHVFEAFAPGRVAWRATVRVEAVAKDVDLEVPVLASKTAGPAPLAPFAPLPPPAAEAPGRTQRTIAAILGGTSVVALGIGTYFGLHSLVLKNDADGCPGCAEVPDLRARAWAEGDRATGMFIAGGVLLAGAAIVWLTAPSSHAGAEGARASR